VAEGTTNVSIEERIARTRETFEAMASADLEKILEGFAEDAVWHSELRSSDFRGKAAIRAEELRQLDEFTGSMTLHDVCASSDHVVALFEMFPGTAAAPGPADGRLVLIAHTDDQAKITEFWSIYNPLS
jgi:ketosteroid isomerase-like protein